MRVARGAVLAALHRGLVDAQTRALDDAVDRFDAAQGDGARIATTGASVPDTEPRAADAAIRRARAQVRKTIDPYERIFGSFGSAAPIETRD
jgi:hypothetical protein